MKAWRSEKQQAEARLAYFNTLAADHKVGIAKAYELAYGGRGGKIAKARHVKVQAVPSVPMQQLLLRAGLWASIDPVALKIDAERKRPGLLYRFVSGVRNFFK